MTKHVNSIGRPTSVFTIKEWNKLFPDRPFRDGKPGWVAFDGYSAAMRFDTELEALHLAWWWAGQACCGGGRMKPDCPRKGTHLAG